MRWAGVRASACWPNILPDIVRASSRPMRMTCLRAPMLPEERMSDDIGSSPIDIATPAVATAGKATTTRVSRAVTLRHGGAVSAARRREIEALGPWFHNLHLPDGSQTAPTHFIGGDFPAFKWREIAPVLPRKLSGWRVLDVGCN